MRSSFAAALWAVFGLSTAVYANDALATFTPCPKCPRGIMPAPITITAQYQAVSTCTPQKICSGKNCHLTPSCSTYDWVSTTIPYLGGATSTVITKTDQIVKLSHVSTVLTSYSPCATTKAPSWNGTVPMKKEISCTKTSYQTMIVDISAPFNELGPLALGNWEGSGLCKTCVPNPDKKIQAVEVYKCLDGKCSTYKETWVSVKPTATASSLSTAPFSSAYSCSSGINKIPVTAAFTPAGDPAYTDPVTSFFSITTSVPSPQIAYFATTIIVTFTAGSEAEAASSSLSAAPVATSTFCSRNGRHTIPITKTFTPTGHGYTDPVTTTIYYTTTVTDAPRTIHCVTTVTVTFTLTVCPIQTVVSGSTISPPPTTGTETSSSSTGPASNSATSTTGSSSSSSSTGGSSSISSTGSSTLSTSTTSGSSSTGSSSTTSSTSSTTSTGPTATPTTPPPNPPTVGIWDFVGCLGSTEGFPTFSLADSNSLMTIEICTTECEANGDLYSGLFTTDCYCASSLDSSASSEAATGVCDIPCPGNPLQSCGGRVPSSSKRRRAVPAGILLDVYEANPTTTSSTPTSSSTPDPSSDPDPEPVKRDIQADMEIAQRRARDDIKLRRGGMLRNPNQASKGPALSKRDYGLKALFGL